MHVRIDVEQLLRRGVAWSEREMSLSSAEAKKERNWKMDERKAKKTGRPWERHKMKNWKTEEKEK